MLMLLILLEQQSCCDGDGSYQAINHTPIFCFQTERWPLDRKKHRQEWGFKQPSCQDIMLAVNVSTNHSLIQVSMCQRLCTRGVHFSLIRRFDTHLDTWATIRFRDDAFWGCPSIPTHLNCDTPPFRNPPLRHTAVPTLPPKHSCSEIKHRYPWCWNPHFQPHSHISEVG